MQQISIKNKNTGGNRLLDYLIDPSFQGVNILFVFSFENVTDRIVSTEYFLLIKEKNI